MHSPNRDWFALGWLMAKGLDGDLAGELVFNGSFGGARRVEFLSRVDREDEHD